MDANLTDPDALEALIRDAESPLPWSLDADGSLVRDGRGECLMDYCPPYRGDAELMLASVNALPGLIRELRAARALVAMVDELRMTDSINLESRAQYDRLDLALDAAVRACAP